MNLFPEYGMSEQYLWLFFLSLHSVWALLWGLVAFHYGRAAMVEWRQSGGKWRNSLSELASPFVWGIKNFFNRKTSVKNDGLYRVMPMVYPPGLLLRFSIFLGSLLPVLIAFLFIVQGFRPVNGVSPILIFFGMSLSILAAGGHLFLAYRWSATAWGNLVFLGTLLMISIPILGYVLLVY